MLTQTPLYFLRGLAEVVVVELPLLEVPTIMVPQHLQIVVVEHLMLQDSLNIL